MTNTKTRRQKMTTKGWSKQQPGTHQRTVMMKKCGKKCFLGPNKSFPICKKNTCKISKKGVYAAYIRSRQYRKSKKNRNVTKKTKKLLKNF